MDYVQALERLHDHKHIKHFRRLCDNGNPDVVQRDAIRKMVIDLADDKPPPQYPSPLKQAGNFIKAVTTHVMTGAQEATPEEVERRKVICTGCEFYDTCQKRCRKCGCFVETKAAWLEQKCPLDKWAMVESSEKSPVESSGVSGQSV